MQNLASFRPSRKFGNTYALRKENFYDFYCSTPRAPENKKCKARATRAQQQQRLTKWWISVPSEAGLHQDPAKYRHANREEVITWTWVVVFQFVSFFASPCVPVTHYFRLLLLSTELCSGTWALGRGVELERCGMKTFQSVFSSSSTNRATDRPTRRPQPYDPSQNRTLLMGSEKLVRSYMFSFVAWSCRWIGLWVRRAHK